MTLRASNCISLLSSTLIVFSAALIEPLPTAIASILSTPSMAGPSGFSPNNAYTILRRCAFRLVWSGTFLDICRSSQPQAYRKRGA
ncbi:hypothetical protein BDV41DRAFT_144391 [Aspergillus transmontanensis]|uniref:Secreted protein n=1 Tax=Aspergillus transmontanensis TaxID=1034304 RepID=A0A5N6W5S4_9EURO|nr:hypothetical protein BDV41DRAFT_144391 [Aspergillus transmontanensis]